MYYFIPYHLEKNTATRLKIIEKSIRHDQMVYISVAEKYDRKEVDYTHI